MEKWKSGKVKMGMWAEWPWPSAARPVPPGARCPIQCCAVLYRRTGDSSSTARVTADRRFMLRHTVTLTARRMDRIGWDGIDRESSCSALLSRVAGQWGMALADARQGRDELDGTNCGCM